MQEIATHTLQPSPGQDAAVTAVGSVGIASHTCEGCAFMRKASVPCATDLCSADWSNMITQAATSLARDETWTCSHAEGRDLYPRHLLLLGQGMAVSCLLAGDCLMPFLCKKPMQPS